MKGRNPTPCTMPRTATARRSRAGACVTASSLSHEVSRGHPDCSISMRSYVALLRALHGEASPRSLSREQEQAGDQDQGGPGTRDLRRLNLCGVGERAGREHLNPLHAWLIVPLVGNRGDEPPRRRARWIVEDLGDAMLVVDRGGMHAVQAEEL